MIKILQYIFGCVWLPLSELCRIRTGKLNANAMDKDGLYPFFTCDAKPYRINEYAFDTSAILISGNGSQVGHVNIYDGKFNAYQRTYVLDDFRYVDKKFLYHYFLAFLKNHILNNSLKASVPYITLPILSEFKVPIPNIQKQQQIASDLDKFEKLCNDSTTGLLAEIKVRKIQHSYYADKILTFERKVA